MDRGWPRQGSNYSPPSKCHCCTPNRRAPSQPDSLATEFQWLSRRCLEAFRSPLLPVIYSVAHLALREIALPPSCGPAQARSAYTLRRGHALRLTLESRDRDSTSTMTRRRRHLRTVRSPEACVHQTEHRCIRALAECNGRD